MLELDPCNYYSPEADREYMSFSQYKTWLKCPAAKYAQMFDGWQDPNQSADHFVAGRFAHAMALEPETIHDAKAEYPELYGKTGKRYAKHAWVEPTIAAIQGQPVFAAMLANGDREVIIVYEFGGVAWKARIDNLRLDDCQFDDLKFMASFDDRWDDNTRRKVSWWMAYDYHYQMASYAAAIEYAHGVKCRPNIIGATKEDPPDLQWLQMQDADGIASLQHDIAENLQEVMRWKTGKEKPPRCGKCVYCRQTKQIKQPIVMEVWA